MKKLISVLSLVLFASVVNASGTPATVPAATEATCKTAIAAQIDATKKAAAQKALDDVNAKKDATQAEKDAAYAACVKAAA